MAVAVRRSIWALLTPVILVSGIVSGVVTPTETAGVALVYAIFIVRFVYRALDFRAIFRLPRSTSKYPLSNRRLADSVPRHMNCQIWASGPSHRPA